MEIGNGHLTSFWTDIWLGDSPLIMHTLVAASNYLLQFSVAKMWQGISWDWKLISPFLPHSLYLQLEAMVVSPHLEDKDELAWKGTSFTQFSIKSAFQMQRIGGLAQMDKV